MADVHKHPHDIRIEELTWSTRVSNILKREGIVTIGDLVKHSRSEIARWAHMGTRSINEVIAGLADLGLDLDEKPPLLANGHFPSWVMLPRAERNCGNCDHARYHGELRCWIDPPEPLNVGFLPPREEGQLPRPTIIAIQKPTWSWYCCKRWEMRTADHPDYERIEEQPVVEITHAGTEARQ